MFKENQVDIESIENELTVRAGVQLDILRLDKIHPLVSGNKWFKLKYNLQEAIWQGYHKVLSFGGAYSNHIHALSAAAKDQGLKSTGIIRGEKVEPLNPTLKFAEEQGMELRFVSRTDFRELKTAQGMDNLRKEYPGSFMIPEGGSNVYAVKGCQEIVGQINPDYDAMILAVGTGGTMAGIVAGNYPAKVIGIPVLKGGFLQNDIEKLLDQAEVNERSNFRLIEDYHFGGYAKFNDHLIDFINRFKMEQGIQLDPIYTGKMMYGLFDLIKKDYWNNGIKVLAIHTGGLQGIQGFNQRFGIVLD